MEEDNCNPLYNAMGLSLRISELSHSVFKNRRDQLLESLNDMKGITCNTPNGAFYVFPSCKEIIGKKTKDGIEINNDEDFTSALLKHAGVAVVQGSAFGLEGYFRISYATSDENLTNACDRISKFCSELE